MCLSPDIISPCKCSLDAIGHLSSMQIFKMLFFWYLMDYIFLVRRFNPQSTGAFLALPLNQLSTWYVAVTSCLKGECMIVVASPYNQNRVTVSLAAYKGSNPSNITYKSTVYQNGDQINEELQGVLIPWSDSFALIFLFYGNFITLFISYPIRFWLC